MDENNNWSWSVGGAVMRGNDILLVRHTYGAAKGKMLIPGGFVKHNEMPEAAVLREIYEETGITAQIRGFLGIRFQSKNWYAMFLLDYDSGEPRIDGDENDFAGFIPLEEALKREDVTGLSRMLIEAISGGVPLTPLNEEYYNYSGKGKDETSLYGLQEREY